MKMLLEIELMVFRKKVAGVGMLGRLLQVLGHDKGFLVLVRCHDKGSLCRDMGIRF